MEDILQHLFGDSEPYKLEFWTISNPETIGIKLYSNGDLSLL